MIRSSISKIVLYCTLIINPEQPTSLNEQRTQVHCKDEIVSIAQQIQYSIYYCTVCFYFHQHHDQNPQKVSLVFVVRRNFYCTFAGKKSATTLIVPGTSYNKNVPVHVPVRYIQRCASNLPYLVLYTVLLYTNFIGTTVLMYSTVAINLCRTQNFFVRTVQYSTRLHPPSHPVQ